MYRLRSAAFFPRMPAGNRGRVGAGTLLPTLLLTAVFLCSGCTASRYRQRADKAALTIIHQDQKTLFGKARKFTIERPADILRSRLLIEQDLPYASKASLGSDKLHHIAHWPEKNYPKADASATTTQYVIKKGEPLRLSIIQALQVGAANSSEYQGMKEKVYQAALTLKLQRHTYGFIFAGDASSEFTKTQSTSSSSYIGNGNFVSGSSVNQTGMVASQSQKALISSGNLSLSKTLKYGATLATSIGINLVNLLTGGRTFSKSVTGDASISIPLLRGAGSYIAAETLTQAQRDVIYALYDLERFKKTYAVQVVNGYLGVLQQNDQVENAAENYKSLISSSKRTRALANAGRATIIEVNQAISEELSARARWISAMEQYKNQFDSFKTLIGLPVDANIELERSELKKLTESSHMKAMMNAPETASKSSELVPPSRENAGPLEMDETRAIKLAFKNRLDLRVTEGKVYDAQRAVVVAANKLKADLTLTGTMVSGQSGGGGSSQMAGSSSGSTGGTSGGVSMSSYVSTQDTSISLGNASYTGLLSLNLPFNRTSEGIAYRNSYISLEEAVRNEQTLEDNIKSAVRQDLRKMAEARESLRIQTQAVSVAENRSKSTEMFFEAGRSELRDLLEAESALLTARNALTSAVVDYRVAELSFERDAGILNINDKGLLVEYASKENKDVNIQ